MKKTSVGAHGGHLRVEPIPPGRLIDTANGHNPPLDKHLEALVLRALTLGEKEAAR